MVEMVQLSFADKIIGLHLWFSIIKTQYYTLSLPVPKLIAISQLVLFKLMNLDNKIFYDHVSYEEI